jgi:hypothetical protein
MTFNTCGSLWDKLGERLRLTHLARGTLSLNQG